ncbi:thioesterase family protein [Aestuariivirga litoralis]|uniref:thioesterase family protein n=1 Tax=Aestuariivirga litoralis TaxID=2650924 RepID=UPI0018C77D5D|nr:thioesterase family protein [Aestuariivirga litoralis]MBG1232585.1 thioesterase [Aestuariivirga litoralis]
MNLWFRLIWVVLASLRAPPMRWNEKIIQHFRCWPSDLDFNLHMTNARYFALMDLGRMELIVRGGLGKLMRRDGLMPVIAGSMIRFRRPIQPFQRITLATQVLCWDAKWMFIEHRIEREGELMCQSIVKAAFVKKGGTMPPAEMAKSLGHEETSPPLPDWIVQWQQAELAAGGKGKS